MLINKLNLTQNTGNITINKTNYVNNLSSDTFQKSPVSFGSAETREEEINNLTNDLNNYISAEIYFQTYLDVLCARKNDVLFISKKMKLDDFHNKLFGESFFKNKYGFINDLLKSENINSTIQLTRFLQIYEKSKKVFNFQGIEALRIYQKLERKTDLTAFPEMLLNIYQDERDKETPDFEKLNKTLDFLLKLGVKNFEETDTKFSHLKTSFNDFNTTADKIDAINYIQETYEDKINYLSEILKTNPSTGKLSAEEVYKNNNDVIDYLYSANGGENLGDLSQYIDILVKHTAAKPNAYKIINDFTEPEEKVEAYKFLKEISVNPSDLNNLTSKSIISDIDLLSVIINYAEISQAVSEIKGINESESKETYKKFKGVINAVIKNDDNEGLPNLLNIIDKFGFNNDDSFLSYYQKVYGTKNKTVTSEEFKNLIELLKYSDTKDVFKNAKSQNISPLEFLTREKEQTQAYLKIINDFLLSDDTDFFTGQSNIEIYNEYKNLIKQNPENIPGILQTISDYNISNSKEYKEKALEIKKFEKFFPDRKNLLDFINRSQIKFDNSEKENQYRQACLDILNSLQDESDKEKSKERINYYLNSSFLLKSKNHLSKFVSSSDNKKKIFSIIADKKVPDIDSLKKYRGENKSIENVIDFISELPENIDFSTFSSNLQKIQKQINLLNIPCKINNDNIKKINPEYVSTNSRLTLKQLNDLLVKMYNTTGNMITTLPSSLKEEQNYYSKYRIAQEIVNKSDNPDSSYKNIERLFNLKINDENDYIDDGYSSDAVKIKQTEERLSEEFFYFVNSNNWLDYNNDKNKVPNVSLHARLRAIDRFALENCDDINSLYTQQTRDKMKDLFKTIYTSNPVDISGNNDKTKRIILDSEYNSSIVESVFTNYGEMVTIFKKEEN